MGVFISTAAVAGVLVVITVVGCGIGEVISRIVEKPLTKLYFRILNRKIKNGT